MANNTKYTGLTNYANYHTFSKLQVGNNVNFGGSINRSGHTVTNTDAWLDDVPFFNTFTTPSAALDAVGKSTVKNDLVSIAVAEGDITPGIYRRNEVANTDGTKTFSEIFEAYTIGADTKDGAPVLLNKNDKAVVRVWNKQALTLLTGTNNSNANAEGQAARIIVDGTPVEQFIAVPDVSRSGYPSNGYGIKVYNDGTPMTMDFGTVENTFFDVPFAGVIMFGGGTDGSVYTIDCFEYIGDKLAAVNTKIADIQETIENLTIEAGAGIKTLTPAEGSGITVITSGVEGASSITPIIDIDTDVIATKASVDEVAKDVTEIQQTIESGVVSSVTASSAAQTAGITIGGTDTEPEIQVTVGEVSDSSDAVVTGKAVAAAIETAKQAAIDNAKVTLIQGTGIAVTPNNTSSNSFTVAVDNTVATAQSVTDLAGRVTTAEGEIDTLQETVEGLTSGENSVDSKITAAKTEITGTEIAEQSVSGAGIIVTLDGTVGAPTLTGSVTTATYTPATETAAGSWSSETQVVTAGAVKSALADVDAKHTADIEKVETAIESLSTSGFSRVIVTELPTTDIKLNAIYLVANKESDANEYVEYIYVGGAVTDGQVSGGRFEQIGTTKTDLSEYAKTADVNAAIALKADQTALDATNAEVAKKANSADVYTKNEVDAAQEATDAAIAAAAAKGQQGITDAAAAKSAADAAQADATQALADAATAQGEVDALEGVVSALSQVVADNKSATDAAIATKAAQTALDETNATVAGHTASITEITGTTIPAITGRLDAIEAIPTVEVVASTAADKYIEVTPSTANGKTTFTVGTTAALENRLDAIDEFIGTSEGSDLANLLAAKVDTVTGGSNGITIATADTEAGRVATLTVTPDTAVTQDSAKLVTSGAVHTAITASASATLDSAKSYAEEQIGALKETLNDTVTAENTAISVTQTDGKVTAITVIKGAVTDNDTNLVDGSTVYAVTSGLQTAVDKKVDSTTYTADKQVIDTAIEALQGFADGADDAYAVKGTEQVAADAAAAAEAAQGSADKKIASIGNNSDARVIIGTPTADGDSKSVTISLASTVATTTDGTAYSKSETDDAIATAVGTAVQSVTLATDNTQTAISIATSDANAVTVTVADNIATVDKVTIAEDGSITVDTEGTTYSKATVDKMVAEAKPENFVAAISGYDATGTLQTTTQGATVKVVDERGDSVTANDLWGTSATLSADGTLSVVNGWVTNPNISEKICWDPSVKSVIDNKAYTSVDGSGAVYANIQTDRIKDGSMMFYGTSLASFDSDLSSLENGNLMFGQTQIKDFNIDLPSLENGNEMFIHSTLTTFESTLPSLTEARMMFEHTGLVSFTCDLSALEDGYYMFASTNLASFTGDLSSLDAAFGMFNGCKLDTDSVVYIAESIKDWGMGAIDHSIAIHVADTTSPEIPELLNEIANKGWTVSTNYPNWTAPATTALDGETTSQPIFAIARPVENEKYATHKNAAGEFFAVEIANMVIGPEVHKWAIFATAEDAITEWDLTPVTK